MENVIVIGASANEERYSNKAMKMLAEYGHNPIPVAPAKDKILDKKVYTRASDVTEKVDTVTMYVGPARQEGLFEQIISFKPRRVIFNPGTENPAEYDRLKAAGIEVIEACTLVMLRTSQF
jgi:predicted CoA-binding protein